jgi:calcium-binding protein CML
MYRGSRKRCKYSQGSNLSGGLCNDSYANDNSDTDSKSDDSPNEAVILRRIYDTVDENRDGKLTIEEIRGFLNKLGIQMSDEDVESIVGPLSTSDDGSLKFEQFILLYESLCQDIGLSTDHEEEAESPDHLMEAFQIFDKNGDGYISSEELQQILHSLGLAQSKDLADCEEMICRFDLDSNGLLDFSEFKIMMMRYME